MWVLIDDAPFTEKEKEKIKKLGVTSADWGYPEVDLPDPVAYFKESIKNFGKGIPGTKKNPLHYEETTDPDDQPFGAGS